MKKMLFVMLASITMHVFGQGTEFEGNIAGYYGTSNFSVSESSESVTIIGTVMLKNEVWVIYGSAGNSGDMQDYYPSNLTKSFQVDGLRVSVKAKLISIPDNVRLAGAPITIVEIKKL